MVFMGFTNHRITVLINASNLRMQFAFIFKTLRYALRFYKNPNFLLGLNILKVSGVEPNIILTCQM